eukprot:TRINITY_DN4070_c0_g1_i4.p1 TRINITY_DN4070_c0_g1~~TRINITY_DN4070_c0_g1_i4.p1  ORF type:complete len:410 (-),score=74.35 TRINITY_DN4070_c0_g1_i4:79-1308(-)
MTHLAVKHDWTVSLMHLKSKARSEPSWLWDTAHANGFSVLKAQNVALHHVFSPSFSTFSYHTPSDWEPPSLARQKRSTVRDGDRRQMDCWGDVHLQEHFRSEAMQFMDTEPGVPKYVLSESMQAHNRWPYAAQYDPYLLAFITELLHRQEDIFTVLSADHGYGFADRWERDVHKYPGSDFERLLPFLALIVPTSHLTPTIAATLSANQQRPISHYDLHLTLHNLFKQSTPPAHTTSRIPGFDTGVALDILHEEVPANRTCAQMGITAKSCLCNAWSPLDVSSRSAKAAAELGVEYINKQRIRPAGACLVVEVDQILVAVQKKPIKVGYRNSPGEDKKFGLTTRVEFSGTASTRWRVVVEANRIIELQVMHRYSPLQDCHDGSAPLKYCCLLYTSPSPRDRTRSRMPSSA